MRSKFLHEGKEPLTTCNIISAAAAAGITAGIGAASAIGSSVANGVTATKLNKKNRVWQEKMYERRLADERENWQTENEYNSPVQQVERMRAAGINPDLYGIDGAGTASQINTPDANFEYQAPDFTQGFQILSGIFDSVMNMQSQVIDNDLKITDERGKLSGLFNLLLGTGSDSSQVVDYLTKGLSKGLSRSFKKNRFGITSDNAFGIHREVPHMTFSQLNDWTEKLEAKLKEKGRRKVAIKTVFTSAPGVIKEFEKTENYKKLTDMGVVVSYICPLMYMNNPMCAKMPVITNSNKLRTYTTSRYYSDSEILDQITGGAK